MSAQRVAGSRRGGVRASGARRSGTRAVRYAPLRVDGWGELWIAWSRRGLVALRLPPSEPGGDEEDALRMWLDERFERVERDREPPIRYARALLRYFAGEPELLELPIDPQGTPFQLRVWNALRKIPRGRVRSYVGIARDIDEPRAMRAIGRANHDNPIPVVVPCHRVVEAGLGLGGYSGGLDLKRRLLALEGVEVRGDRVVPPGQLSLEG